MALSPGYTPNPNPWILITPQHASDMQAASWQASKVLQHTAMRRASLQVEFPDASSLSMHIDRLVTRKARHPRHLPPHPAPAFVRRQPQARRTHVQTNITQP